MSGELFSLAIGPECPVSSSHLLPAQNLEAGTCYRPGGGDKAEEWTGAVVWAGTGGIAVDWARRWNLEGRCNMLGRWNMEGQRDVVKVCDANGWVWVTIRLVG